MSENTAPEPNQDAVEELIDELEVHSISIAHDLTQPCSLDCSFSDCCTNGCP